MIFEIVSSIWFQAIVSISHICFMLLVVYWLKILSQDHISLMKRCNWLDNERIKLKFFPNDKKDDGPF